MNDWLAGLRNTLFPHEDNGRHPYLFRLEMAALLFAIVVVIECAPFLASTLANTAEQLASVLPGVVTTLTNEERTAGQLMALSPNPLLAQAAQAAASDMAANGYFAHVSPSGKDPWYWLSQAGYRYQYAGENLAVNFNDSEQVVSAWMNSPSHRANILDIHYTEIGIGMAAGMYQGAPAVFIVQFFAAPQKVAVTAPASVPTPTPIETVPAQKVLAATTQAKNPSPPVSLGTKVTASPFTYTTDALLVILAGVVLIYMLGFMPLPFAHRFPHPRAMAVGLAFILLMAGMVAFNNYVLLGKVALPAGGEAAAVALH